MRRFYKLAISILICIILIQPLALLAQEYSDKEIVFFDFEKYKYTYLYFYNFQYSDSSTAGLAERTVKRVAEVFVKGFDALRKGQIDEAILQFRKSSRLLPEYFHIDFIIALAYEMNSDFENAARFYKSYLGKLDRFQRGMYRLTQPLIEKTVDFNVSDYEEAKELIEQRMARYGIDMQEVSLRQYPLLFIMIIFAVIGVVILYSATKIDSIKRVIYKTRAKRSRSKGHWICLYCGKENANINLKCHNCGKDAGSNI